MWCQTPFVIWPRKARPFDLDSQQWPRVLIPQSGYTSITLYHSWTLLIVTWPDPSTFFVTLYSSIAFLYWSCDDNAAKQLKLNQKPDRLKLTDVTWGWLWSVSFKWKRQVVASKCRSREDITDHCCLCFTVLLFFIVVLLLLSFSSLPSSSVMNIYHSLPGPTGGLHEGLGRVGWRVQGPRVATQGIQRGE